MNKVCLTKDGRLVVNDFVITGDPLMFLGYEVEIDGAYTLRSFFELFVRYPALEKINAFLPSYLEQYRSSPASGCTHSGFDFLEFSKTVEMIGYPGEPRLEIYHSFYGVCQSETFDLRSVELKNILDMPLKLGKLKHIVFGDRVDAFEFDTVFNLFEYLDGILWELSFQGTLMACEFKR